MVNLSAPNFTPFTCLGLRLAISKTFAIFFIFSLATMLNFKYFKNINLNLSKFAEVTFATTITENICKKFHWQRTKTVEGVSFWHFLSNRAYANENHKFHLKLNLKFHKQKSNLCEDCHRKHFEKFVYERIITVGAVAFWIFHSHVNEREKRKIKRANIWKIEKTIWKYDRYLQNLAANSVEFCHISSSVCRSTHAL